MSVNKKEIPMEWYQLYFACGITWLVLTGLAFEARSRWVVLPEHCTRCDVWHPHRVQSR